MNHIQLLDTRAVQDFLKTVYTLQSQSERVSINPLAEVLSISAHSVTDMALRQDFNLGDIFPITLMFTSGNAMTTNVDVVEFPPSI